jgi:hypothetical protein
MHVLIEAMSWGRSGSHPQPSLREFRVFCCHRERRSRLYENFVKPYIALGPSGAELANARSGATDDGDFVPV